MVVTISFMLRCLTVLLMMSMLLSACGLSLELPPPSGTQTSDSKGSLKKGDAEQRTEFRTSYDVRVDESRTVRVDVDVTYKPYLSFEDAEAGMVDIYTDVKGSISFRNKSENRAVRRASADHRLEYMLPASICILDPIYRSVIERAEIPPEALEHMYCSSMVAEVRSPNLEPGETDVESFDKYYRVGSVLEGDGKAWISAAKTAALVAGADERYPVTRSGLNSACTYGDENIARTVFWTSVEGVDLCSTESPNY